MATSQTTETIRHHKIAEENPNDALLAQAESAIEKKDYATAEPLLLRVTQADPANYVGWFDLGFVYNILGRPEASIAAYRKSVAAKPEVFESNLNLGLMLAKSAEPDAAQYLRTATTLTPTDRVNEGRARAWLSLAHVLEPGDPKQALESYRQAAQLQPKDPEPHLSAAQLLAKTGDLAGAIAECNQALAIDSSSDQALQCSVEMNAKNGHYSEAAQSLQKIADTHPDDPSPRLQLAQLLLLQERNDEAVGVLQEALKLDPNNQSAQTNLAQTYFKLGKYTEAATQYRALVAKAPNDPDLHARLGQALLKQLKYADAEKEFLVAVQLRPKFGEVYGDLATAAVENKDYQLAIRAVDTRDQILPPLPVGYFLRASAYDHLQDYKLAAVNYHRFLELANGKYPDQEWQARHRLIAIEPKK